MYKQIYYTPNLFLRYKRAINPNIKKIDVRIETAAII